MECYNKINNPLTGRKVSIYSRLGKQILKKYIQFGGKPACIPIKQEVLPSCDPKCSGSSETNSLILHPHDAILPFNNQTKPMQLAWWYDQSIPNK